MPCFLQIDAIIVNGSHLLEVVVQTEHDDRVYQHRNSDALFLASSSVEPVAYCPLYCHLRVSTAALQRRSVDMSMCGSSNIGTCISYT